MDNENSLYYACILVLYWFVCTLMFFFRPDLLPSFVLSADDIFIVVVLFILAFPVLLSANYLVGFGTIHFRPERFRLLPAVIVYSGLLMAMPEEMLFRGIIQGFMHASFQNALLAVIVSSLVFGLAHCFNGATGISPKHWNWKFVILATIAGVLFGCAYMYTGNISAPIYLHAAILSVMYVLFERK